MSAATSSGAVRRVLADGRWHFQHGPIDCIVAAEGDCGAAAQCVDHAWSRFRGLLDELVAELPLLRVDLASAAGAHASPQGRVAKRMVEACRAQAAGGRFITAMAAVAGSVADELITSFDDARIVRASVNNGGDIALHLRGDAAWSIGLCTDPARTLTGGALDGRFRIDSGSGVRGVATSGWRGRSVSLGIADSVTVLAASASLADAAATVIANAVDVAHECIVRAPATDVRDDSDLGRRLVTRHVPPLPDALVQAALARGAAEAQAQIGAGRIIAAVLSLQGRFRACGRVPEHAPLAAC